MAVENANRSNATATNFPPYSPKVPWEKAFAVNSAELTSDLPSTVTLSFILPFSTFKDPVYGLLPSLIIISSAIDLECNTVMSEVDNFPSCISIIPENSFTSESRYWT